jgi:tetraacyldisaccharide 4'-kinase
VISVGNLHWGGVGKTPVVAAIAGHLRSRGLATAILSRGYGRKDQNIRVVSTGEGPLLGPLVAGDEPVLLAGELTEVAVVVGSDRFEAGRHALERIDPPPQVFVLDDGFSHLRLFRDIDLIVLPEVDPVGGGRLLPGGRLREPLTAVSRADAALMVGRSDGAARDLGDALRRFGFTGRSFACRMQTGNARLVAGEDLPGASRVVAVAAIGRPERFMSAVRAAGFDVAEEITFPDHHDYPDRSLRRIEQAFATTGADAVLTTAKDRVKLLRRLQVPIAELPVSARPAGEFWSWLDRRLDQQVAELDR